MFGHDSNNDNAQQDNQTIQPDATLSAPPAPATTLDSLDPPVNPVTGTPPVANTADDTATPAPSAPATNTDDMLKIKQDALQQLSPLVGHLDQTPEEKFRTTMMMIQASDDQSLISTAYEAAKAITDEKARAQALLDIVNEINYFTQQAQQ